MTGDGDAPSNADGPIDRDVSAEALRQLGDAVGHLGGDADYIIRSLTDMLRAMRPVSREGRLTEQQERFLIESGDFTVEELAATKSSVDRGSLQLGAAETFLSNLFATMSLEDAAGFLGCDEEAIRAAVSEGRLYAIDISGRLRFPTWQFSVASPEKLIPGLDEVIKVVTPRWGWQSVAGFMATPQTDLAGEGRKTPVQWLRDGGDVQAVRQIVESDDWW